MIVIWALCFGLDRLIPPLMMLRDCIGADNWGTMKGWMWILAVPVGFPVAYLVRRCQLERRRAAETVQEPGEWEFPEEELTAKPSADPVKRAAKWLTALYVAAVGGVICYAQWFLPPFRAWVESEIQGHLPRMLCFVLAQAILVFLLCVAGGGAVYRRAERWLRGRIPVEKLAEKEALKQASPGDLPRSVVQKKALTVRRVYGAAVFLLTWGWFWIFSPARVWIETLEGGEGNRKVLALFSAVVVANILARGVMGKFVYRLAEGALRRRAEARGEDPDAPAE